mmetsp:Transcript_7233/g.21312  ORF Transcript_7233/g.21312 Transcript_7233/m.21312 type:complete len:565 (-) Transcript_7233:19-1713(-)
MADPGARLRGRDERVALRVHRARRRRKEQPRDGGAPVDFRDGGRLRLDGVARRQHGAGAARVVERAARVGAARPGHVQGVDVLCAVARGVDGGDRPGARLGGRSANVCAAGLARRAGRAEWKGPLRLPRGCGVARALSQQLAAGHLGPDGALRRPRRAVGRRAAQRAWRPLHGPPRGRDAADAPTVLRGGVRHHPLPPARRRGRVLRAVLVRLLGVGRPAARAALLQRRHRLPHVHGLRRLRRRLARLDGGGRGARVRVPADAARVPPPGGGWRVGARGGPVGPKGEAGVRGRAAHLVQLLARLVLLDVCHGRGRGHGRMGYHRQKAVGYRQVGHGWAVAAVGLHGGRRGAAERERRVPLVLRLPERAKVVPLRPWRSIARAAPRRNARRRGPRPAAAAAHHGLASRRAPEPGPGPSLRVRLADGRRFARRRSARVGRPRALGVRLLLHELLPRLLQKAHARGDRARERAAECDAHDALGPPLARPKGAAGAEGPRAAATGVSPIRRARERRFGWSLWELGQMQLSDSGVGVLGHLRESVCEWCCCLYVGACVLLFWGVIETGP